ncbi:MAG: hypothetical protein A4E31_00410 [Methanomassiliicoccales archaeon PtaU1.Bin030]|nr:MAG: hypothetical protein A4E31_00410 [Methanomassiliicoccales archaeon PtaU1.Bin030]
MNDEEQSTTLGEVLVEMRYLRKDVQDLKSKVDELRERPCPAQMCYQHEQRIGTLETYFKIMVGAFISLFLPLMYLVIDKMWGSG